MSKYWFVSVILVSALFFCGPAMAVPITPVLGDAQPFAVLAGSTVTNVPALGTTVTGDVGVWPGSAVTGFGPGLGIVNPPGTIHAGDAVAQSAQGSLTTAFNALNSMIATQDLTGHDLGTSGTSPIGTLSPGVYSFPATSAQLNGQLTLDAGGLDGVYWVFQIGSTLTTASSSSVELINPGANNGSDIGLFWVVGSSATLGTTTDFVGNILADQSITLITGASINNGRALARIGGVSLDDNVISNICPNNLDSFGNPGPGFSGGLGFDDDGNLVDITTGQPAPVIPEPATFMLLGSGIVALLASRKRRMGTQLS